MPTQHRDALYGNILSVPGIKHLQRPSPVLTTEHPASDEIGERPARLFMLTSAEICAAIEEVSEAEATAGEHRRGMPDRTHRGR